MNEVCLALYLPDIQLTITQNEQLTGTFVEVIGKVVDNSAIKLLQSLGLDSDKELGKPYLPRILSRL